MKKFLSKIMVFLILLTIIYIITAQTFRYLDLQVKGEGGVFQPHPLLSAANIQLFLEIT
jgi:hypothetical protein